MRLGRLGEEHATEEEAISHRESKNAKPISAIIRGLSRLHENFLLRALRPASRVPGSFDMDTEKENAGDVRTKRGSGKAGGGSKSKRPRSKGGGGGGGLRQRGRGGGGGGSSSSVSSGIPVNACELAFTLKTLRAVQVRKLTLPAHIPCCYASVQARTTQTPLTPLSYVQRTQRTQTHAHTLVALGSQVATRQHKGRGRRGPARARPRGRQRP